MLPDILICDDSEMARKQMARALPAALRQQVSFCCNGKEALARIRNKAPDLLFLDLNMPELDGYGVLEHLHSEQIELLTIVVSGDIQPQAKARVFSLGATAFLNKPTAPAAVTELLAQYGIYSEPEQPLPSSVPPAGSQLEANVPDHPANAQPDLQLLLNDYLREIANVAMGRSSDLLARLLGIFVRQPIPTVAFIASSELHMTIAAANDKTHYSAVCQGFTGAGVAGEALLLFADSSFREMAEMLHYDNLDGPAVNIEVLMDMSSILFGAFLKGIGDQMDLRLGLSHPTVLGQHRQIAELLDHHHNREQQLLCIEITYTIENHNIQCDMLVLFTEDSLPFLQQRLQYLVE
ncbi:MAG: response regulator [Marinobacter sp.]